MSFVLLRWSGEVIRLECTLKSDGRIDFDEGPHGSATEDGIPYEYELQADGKLDFGNEYSDNRFWRTDLHEIRIKLGTIVTVAWESNSWPYEIVSII